MEIKPGMKFRGNVNDREILILRVSDHTVQYQDLKYKTVFTVGRKMFMHLDIKEIPTAETVSFS